ncbi:ATP-binding cassette domain-containing protein [Brucella endophytica]|nr:ATP-binding cassette domain-containing protein [Brucella endophytica]
MSTQTPLVQLQAVSRVYRSRRHTGAWWRQLLKPEFNEHLALDEASLEIHAGQCLGLVGPNGAGKSTLVKLLTGLLQPDSGQISVLGFDPGKRQSAMLNQIGVVFGHKSSLWWDLPVKHSFEAVQKIYQTPPDVFNHDAQRYAELLRIDHLMQRAVRQLSLGERIKCELVLALAHQPRLLLLDEPTIGVDMESKQQLRAVINQILREKKIAVLLTTHDVNDLLACCSHIALLQAGELFQYSALKDLLGEFGLTSDNSRGLEDCLIEAFRARRDDDEEIEFGSVVLAGGVPEDDDEDV